MFGILLAVGLLLFGYTKRASGNPEQIVEPTPPENHTVDVHSSTHERTIAMVQPLVVPEVPTPTPVIVRPTPLPVTPPDSFKQPVSNKVTVRASATGCVRYLLVRGIYVPPNPRIHSKYLPVSSTALPPEGKKVVIVTYESGSGHVALAENRGGKLITLVDSVGSGRVIPPHLYKGYL